MVRRAVIVLAVVTSLGHGSAVAETTATEPGTAPEDAPIVATAAAPASPVAPVFADSGRISLSVDAVGTNDDAGADVEVAKPAGGTVRRAFFTAASTGFTQYEPQDGDVVLDGQPITWDAGRTMVNGIRSVNVWADVTSLVKPKLDAAPAGRVRFRVVELEAVTTRIDGGILAVVFDDPTASIDGGVVLAYGAQQVTGDRIELVRLPGVPLTDVTVSLGIGVTFGFQPSSQDSLVDVNGVRLTSSAGGHDDGEGANGALVTVGGLDDSAANPADPFSRGSSFSCPRCDDELYDLTSFVTDTDATLLELTTQNPSADDNFMFAALDVKGATVRWGPPAEGIGYVAVGDSTTTGFSIPTCDVEDRKDSAYGCVGDPPVTPYPERIAAANARFADLARKGIWGYTVAEAVDDFERGKNEHGTWEPQLVTAQKATELVTVSLGANDMQFSDIPFWLGKCVGAKQKSFLGRVYLSPEVAEQRCRDTARARATAPALASDLDAMFDALDGAAANGAEVVITEYYNPYNHTKVVRFLPDRSCHLIHTIGDIITSAINDELARRAVVHNFTLADFKAPFEGHGAGSADSYVFGTECEVIGALDAVRFDLIWPPLIDRDASLREIKKRFDPHPNAAGTRAQAQAILEVAS